jgi:hypothetical protein
VKATERTVALANELKIPLNKLIEEELHNEITLKELNEGNYPEDARLIAIPDYDSYTVRIAWYRVKTEEELKTDIANVRSALARKEAEERARYVALKKKFEP